MQAIFLSFYKIYTPTLSGPYLAFDQYIELFKDPEFWSSLHNNLIWTVGTLFFQITIGIAIAMMLHQNFPARALARALCLFPYLLPMVVAVLVWKWLFNDLYGFLNHLFIGNVFESFQPLDFPVDYLGSMPNAMISIILVGAWKYFPFVVIAVLARLQTIPPQLYEAAMMDGANAWQRFWDVTIPQLRSVLVIVILLRSIWDFKEFDLIYLMTGGGPVRATQTLSLLVYEEAFRLNRMGMASTYAVAMMLVLLGFTLVYLRQTNRLEEG